MKIRDITLMIILIFSPLASSDAQTPQVNYNGPFDYCPSGLVSGPLDNFCPRLESVPLKQCCKPKRKALTCYYYPSNSFTSRPSGCSSVSCSTSAPAVETLVVQLTLHGNLCCFACPAKPGYTVLTYAYTQCSDVPVGMCDPPPPTPSSGGGSGTGGGNGNNTTPTPAPTPIATSTPPPGNSGGGGGGTGASTTPPPAPTPPPPPPGGG